MAFYAGQVIAGLDNPTLVIITDRNDLDDQLFGTFSMCTDLLRQTPQQAQSREDLQRSLSRPSGGVIFTSLQRLIDLDADVLCEGHYGIFKLNSDPSPGILLHSFTSRVAVTGSSRDRE